MVQDPNFWRRFSVAVHNDEAAILAKDLESGSGGGTRKQETKHALKNLPPHPLVHTSRQLALEPPQAAQRQPPQPRRELVRAPQIRI
ncbi:hypothetical protein E8E13_009033 [Curvularia kusanoi]|uniref:Uncharacterized protein n=1 Tax=Curvularia kusanoi TaxID=90978 RepID=A0A9P4W8Z8_CURKU|nr:hypothetical protein E8E13_009033 [Curvularia kusanoi]